MSGKKKVNKSESNSEPWYSLNDGDILTVAEELEVKLTKAQIKKVMDRAPDYIDWFAAIEFAINDVKGTKVQPY